MTNASSVTLSHRHWCEIEELFAQMCERSHGALEDLHDRARGILETCRPRRCAPARVTEGDPELWARIHQTVGALMHLYEAAPGDARAIRATAREVHELARRMLGTGAERA